MAHFHALCTLERSEDFASSCLSKEFNLGKENNAPKVNPTPSYMLMVQVGPTLMRMVMAFPDTLSTTIRKDKRTMGLITKSLENGKILLKWMNDK